MKNSKKKNCLFFQNRQFAFFSVLSICLLFKTSISQATDVGSGKTYTTLRAAFDAINNGTLTGAVLLEITSDLTETQSAKLNGSGDGSASYTSVTIRPKGGAWTISGSFSTGSTMVTAIENASAIIHLKGADNVVVDGRIGGTGSTSSLTIANTSTAISYNFAVRLTADASNNTFRYCTLKARNQTTSQGASGIFIQTLTGTNGNDNNTIDHCFFDGDANICKVGFYVSSLQDDNLTISNCEFKNINVAGVQVNNYKDNIAITGNSFYWTDAVYSSTGVYAPIIIGSMGSGNITGNYIGGTAPFCGGTPAVLSTGVSTFAPILMSGSIPGVLNVDANIVSKLDITGTSGSSVGGIFSGITVFNNSSTTGTINIGTTTGNTIGGTTGTGSIVLRTTSNGQGSNLNVYGVRNQGSSSQVNIQKNKIGSITIEASVSNSAVYVSFYGVQNLRQKCTISDNVIGSTTTAKSIENLSGSSLSSTTLGMYGIYSAYTSGGSPTVISNNTISNLYNNSVSPVSVLGGIYASGFSGADVSVTGNSVKNLSTTSTNSATGGSGSLHGIIGSNIGVISGNTISDLYQLDATEAVGMSGITWLAGTGTIEKNYIHHLSMTSPAGSLHGITSVSGSLTLNNNMVHLGLNPDGTAITVGAKINGLNLGSTHEVYHNSVYIGGENVVSSQPTAVVYSSVASPDNKIINNILVNNRSNASGTGRNMIFSGNVGFDPAMVSNYNLFENSGAGLFFAADATTEYPVYSAWKSSGFDANSGETSPMFMNITGNAAAVNMQLQTSNPCESRGTAVAAVTQDYFGNTRNVSTPDIGAAEGSFVQTNPDMQPPVVLFTDIPDQPFANTITLSDFAVVTDDGTIATGAGLPRLYYKRSSNSNVFAGNTSGDDGWKYVTASNAASPFSFELNMSLIEGGPVTTGDVIEYFVVVQDNANHLTAYPAVAGPGAYPPIQHINYSTGVSLKSFTITSTLPIKLVSFTGSALRGVNKLTWVTSSEENNSHFELERSEDGKYYDVIATVKGAHTTSLQQEYQYDDRQPLNGPNYYRLKQVDVDGAFSFSPVLLLRNRSERVDVTALPNPVTSFVKINAPGRLNNARITLLTMGGQAVLRKEGVSGNEFTLDVSGCAKGMYVLEIREGATVVLTKKIMKE